MADEQPATRLESVRVRGYKNLAGIELSWSPAVVLLGANGAGKTNLLECLALMFGTERTNDLLRGRAAPVGEGQLSCVVSGGDWLLPLPPAAARRLAASPSPAGHPMADIERQAQSSMSWWDHLGGADADAASAAVAFVSTPLPRSVSAFLSDLAQRPRILYELQAMPASPAAVRSFTRTLLADAVPAEVLAHAEELPAPFEPMRTWCAGDRTGPATVLALPDAAAAPVRLEWLARARSAEQIDNDLAVAMSEAEPHAQHFAELIAGYLGGDFRAEGRWWLHEHAAQRASAELRRTLPQVTVSGIGEVEESWRITSHDYDTGATDEPGWADALSSGERRWADEALATAARSIADLGKRCAWQAFFWDSATSTGDVELIEQVLALVAAAEEEEYVSAESLEKAAELFDTALTGAARAWNAEGDAAVDEMLHAVVPAVADVMRPPATIRVLDEPEAHLHPAAQRRLADGLSDLAAESSFVLATHSPYLLGRTDWDYVVVSAGRVQKLPPHTLDASSTMASEIGLTRGELLVTARAVLLVEGLHDRAFLRGVFGDGLRAAGVVVVPIFGTSGARALIDSEFWRAFTDIPFHVMFDGTRLPAVNNRRVPSSQLSGEERQMRVLLDSVRAAGRTIGAVGLDRPDIVAYVAEEVLPTGFPGWAAALARWKTEAPAYRTNPRKNFGRWLAESYGVQKTEAAIVEYTAKMARRSLYPPGDIAAKINGLLADPERTWD